ncbi:MAG: aldehyde ferredoxin oxidoreductase family protein [Syntrophomonadaceae bacterium]
MITTGYAGSILEVDLSKLEYRSVALAEQFCRDYLGGIGFNARIVYDRVPAGTDPLGKENLLIFSAGTMVGSTFPTASRTEVSAKSPMTGLFGTSNSGMFFGTHLKNSGFDSLVVIGKSDSPVYLYIEDGKAEIKDASGIWGKDSWETIDTMKKLYPGCEVASIGPAGENLVRYACIENSYFDAWARTGMGAVMGSKNLKAVVVRGTRGIKPDNPERLIEISWKARQLIESSPFFTPFKSYGSMNAAMPYGNFKALNANNFSQGCLPDWKDNFARSQVDKYTYGHIACQSCIIACAHWVEIKEGKYKGLRMKDMEVTPTVSFGSGCGMSLEGTVKACEMSQRYGFDMVSVGGVVAMAIELYNRGLISKEEIGYEMAFGDDDAILRLMDDIAHRRGIGDLLAEGVWRAASIYEGGESSAMHVKGLEIPMIDPRGRTSTWSFGILTNIRGGDHLRCRNPIENLRYNEKKHQFRKERFGFDPQMYETLDMPESLKAQAIDLENDTTDIAVMSYWAENLINLFNSLGVCIRPPVEHRIGPTVLAEAFAVFTGIEVDADELMRAAERSWNLMKLFNLREGEKIEDSKFPRRFYEEEVGGRKLDETQLQEVLKLYYQARGWDMGTGVPTAAKLIELGLDRDWL